MSGVSFLNVDQIIAINVDMIMTYSPEEPIGVLKPNELDSAVHRPQQSAWRDDAYPTIFDKAAALLQSIACNHIFENANKRTAFTAMDIFLQLNGYMFEMNQKDAENLTVWIVDGKPRSKWEDISEIIKVHSHKIPDDFF